MMGPIMRHIRKDSKIVTSKLLENGLKHKSEQKWRDKFQDKKSR